jgi:hypothetical protein
VARINFDDDVEKQEEFWALLERVKGDRDVALGKLLRFFRVAQEAYGYDRPMTREDLDAKGLSVMVDVGWAVAVEGGYQAKGASDHFGWYRANVVNGKKRSEAQRSDNGRFSSSAAPAPLQPTDQQRTSAAPASLQPLALAPALAKGNIYISEPEGSGSVDKSAELEVALGQFQKTLDHFKTGRAPLQSEKEELWKMLKAPIPIEELCHALSGLRYRQKSLSYDPAKDINIFKLWDPQKRAVLVSLSTQQAEKRREKMRGTA